MRFPAKKNAGFPKAPQDFPPRKDGILYPPSGCLGTLLPLPQSLCGRTDVRTDGHVTITSQPKFLGLIGYQICLAMKLRCRALPAGSASKKTAYKNLIFKKPVGLRFPFIPLYTRTCFSLKLKTGSYFITSI